MQSIHLNILSEEGEEEGAGGSIDEASEYLVEQPEQEGLEGLFHPSVAVLGRVEVLAFLGEAPPPPRREDHQKSSARRSTRERRSKGGAARRATWHHRALDLDRGACAQRWKSPHFLQAILLESPGGAASSSGLG